MKSELKHLDEIESFCKTEYLLRKDIHYRKGEILKLEYINAKHCREIERLKSRTEELESELAIRTVPLMKESLKSSARLALAQDDEITKYKNLFEYIKSVIVVLSEKEGNRPVDPSVIDVKYIESAVRYTMPGLFNIYALIGDNDRHKIELADSILHKFGIETMAKYEELIMRGDIDIATIDNRGDFKETHHSGDTGYNTVRKFR